MFRHSVLLVTFLASTTFAVPHGSNFYGQITDSEGAVISAAEIFVRSDNSGKMQAAKPFSTILKTDQKGNFSITLEKGFYDVCVMANSFQPICRKVLIRNEASVEYNLHLKADPLVTKTLGDSF